MRLAATLSLLFLASACVDETLVIGNDRARRACDEAPYAVVPTVGCTTFPLQSTSPYGCVEGVGGGTGGLEHAGSWVHIASGSSGGTLRVELVSSSSFCSGDGGTCPATVLVRSGAGSPCTCDVGTFASYPVGAPLEISLDAPDEEVLFEPLGAAFQVTLCAP